MAVRLTVWCATNWTNRYLLKTFLSEKAKKHFLQFNEIKDKDLNDPWSILASMLNFRLPKCLSVFRVFLFAKEKCYFLRNIFFGLVTIMKIEFPTSEAVIDPVWANIGLEPTAHRLKVWLFTYSAHKAQLEMLSSHVHCKFKRVVLTLSKE